MDPAPLADADPLDPPTRRRLLRLTLAALAVRAAFVLLEPAVPPVADERTWTDGARAVAGARTGLDPFRTHLLIFHPPLYSYFLAVPFRLTGSFELVKWLQVAVTSLLVPAVGRLGVRVFGPAAGLGAAALAAFYPELVWFSAHYWVENVFVVLLLWAFERLVASDAGGSVVPAVTGGALWGLAVLARETGLYFLPLAAAWLAWRAPRPGGRLRAAGFLAAGLLVVVPWTARNWVVFDAFVPVSTAGGLNLFQGNAPMTRQEVYDEYYAVPGKIEQYRHARRRGIEVVLARQPWWIFEKLREQMPMFWEAESMAVIHVKRGAYGKVAPGAAVAVAAFMIAPYLGVLGFFVAGVAGAAWNRRVALLGVFLAYYNLLHVATHGFNRYRLPVMPVVFLFAAVGWAAWREGRPRLLGRRRLAALALASALLASVAPSLLVHWRHPAFRSPASPPAPDSPEAPES
jgi:4-amino-4-deoxy-L-arabinose transferase-like glycosyltransferase